MREDRAFDYFRNHAREFELSADASVAVHTGGGGGGSQTGSHHSHKKKALAISNTGDEDEFTHNADEDDLSSAGSVDSGDMTDVERLTKRKTQLLVNVLCASFSLPMSISHTLIVHS